jgi:hypothetical protein
VKAVVRSCHLLYTPLDSESPPRLSQSEGSRSFVALAVVTYDPFSLEPVHRVLCPLKTATSHPQYRRVEYAVKSSANSAHRTCLSSSSQPITRQPSPQVSCTFALLQFFLQTAHRFHLQEEQENSETFGTLGSDGVLETTTEKLLPGGFGPEHIALPRG